MLWQDYPEHLSVPQKEAVCEGEIKPYKQEKKRDAFGGTKQKTQYKSNDPPKEHGINVI